MNMLHSIKVLGYPYVPYWISRSLPANRHPTPQFVEEVDHEDHVVPGHLRFRSLQLHKNCHALTVRREVEASSAEVRGVHEPLISPRPRLIHHNRIAFQPVSSHHDPVVA